MFKCDAKLYFKASNDLDKALELINDSFNNLSNLMLYDYENKYLTLNYIMENLYQKVNNVNSMVQKVKSSICRFDESFKNDYDALLKESMSIDTINLNDIIDIDDKNDKRKYDYDLLDMLEKYMNSGLLSSNMGKFLEYQRTLIKKYEISDELSIVDKKSSKFEELIKLYASYVLKLIKINPYLSEEEKENKKIIDIESLIDKIKEFFERKGNNSNTDSCYDDVFDNENFTFSTQVSYSGNVDNFTDFQNCSSVYLNTNEFTTFLFTLGEEKYLNKTIYEIYSEYGNNEYFLISLINSGYGDFKVVELVSNEENGLDVLVLEDVMGNYLINFPCTDTLEKDYVDIFYDIYHILNGVYGDNVEGFSSVMESLLNFPSIDIYNSQRKQAIDICKKYANSNSLVNISGFSLGGSLAEECFLELYKSYPDCTGNLLVYEAFHNNLDSNDIMLLEKLYAKGKVNIYSSEGSCVSTYYNHEELKDITKVIYVDYIGQYTNIINQNRRDLCSMEFEFGYFKFSIDDLISSKHLNGIIDEENFRLLVNNADLLFMGAAHSWENIANFASVSFDENGNVKDYVTLVDENGNKYEYKVSNPSFEQITMEVFNTNFEKETKLIIAICNILSELESIKLEDGLSLNNISGIGKAINRIRIKYAENSYEMKIIKAIIDAIGLNWSDILSDVNGWILDKI